MLKPQVTVVVVPRERFSYTKKYTGIPFKLIYIDGNSPQPIKRYLATQSQAKGFRIIRTEKYLSPNQARNLTLSEVDTEYELQLYLDFRGLVESILTRFFVKNKRQAS